MIGSRPERARFSLRSRWRSIVFAWRGLAAMLATQHNTRVHAAATLCALALGLSLGISPLEWCAVTVAVALVWMAEAFNTAVEAVCDLLSPEVHPLVARAKDVAAAGVLIAAAGSGLIGLLVFGPHLVAELR